MNELVVGLDGSNESRGALRWAAAVAERAEAPLRAVEAWSSPSLPVPGGHEMDSPAEIDDRAVEHLRSVVTEVLGDVPSFVTLQALHGPTAAAILETVGPDSVLVLGTRGRGGFAGLVLGSVSRECIEYAPCPVVIVRDDRPPTVEAGVILVGKDGSDHAARALSWATSIGQLMDAEVVAAYAWERVSAEANPTRHHKLRAEAQSTIDGWIAQRGQQVGSIQVEGDARTKLVELAERVDAALVVVARRGTSRLRGLRIGGVTSYLVTNSPTTVAVIPPDPTNER